MTGMQVLGRQDRAEVEAEAAMTIVTRIFLQVP